MPVLGPPRFGPSPGHGGRRRAGWHRRQVGQNPTEPVECLIGIEIAHGHDQRPRLSEFPAVPPPDVVERECGQGVGRALRRETIAAGPERGAESQIDRPAKHVVGGLDRLPDHGLLLAGNLGGIEPGGHHHLPDRLKRLIPIGGQDRRAEPMPIGGDTGA